MTTLKKEQILLTSLPEEMKNKYAVIQIVNNQAWFCGAYEAKALAEEKAKRVNGFVMKS